MKQDPMADYYGGELSGFIYAGGVSVQSAASCANNVLRLSKRVKPTGEMAREMSRIQRQFEDAAECYRQAAALAFPAPALMAAE